MKTPKAFAVAATLLTIALIGWTSAPPPLAQPVLAQAEPQRREPLVVFLVRHGEKADRSADAALSAAGRERADALAKTLRSAKIQRVHSSDFARTRDTTAPTADAHGLAVELYDHRDLAALAEKLRSAGGRHLVVGHSNTTPRVVELLGGEPGAEIDEAGEFDRLYIVTIGRGGGASGALLRYGEAYDPGGE